MQNPAHLTNQSTFTHSPLITNYTTFDIKSHDTPPNDLTPRLTYNLLNACELKGFVTLVQKIPNAKTLCRLLRDSSGVGNQWVANTTNPNPPWKFAPARDQYTTYTTGKPELYKSASEFIVGYQLLLKVNFGL